MVKDIKEWNERVREAMKPQQNQQGKGFSPAIQNIRNTAGNRKPGTSARNLPAAR